MTRQKSGDDLDDLFEWLDYWASMYPLNETKLVLNEHGLTLRVE